MNHGKGILERLILGSVLAFIIAAQGFMAVASPWTEQNSGYNVNLNPGTNPSQYYGAWPGHTYFPSPDDWRKVPIYQFITDRWNDGDPANNELAYPGYDLRDVGARHGGDFLGIRDRLEYIRALGYKAIWISPIFQNRNNSYHGYGQIDFTLLDQRFGTLEDFRAMVNKAHELGMYVIVDIVVNHLENLYYFEGHPNDGALFRLHNGEYRLFPRDPTQTYVDFPVDNTFFPNGTYCDVFGDDGYVRTDSGSGSFWESDLHHNGDLGNYGDPWQNHLGKIYGSLDDIRVTHPRVQDKIIAMTKSLIASTDIDGIRMDTPMQVPRYFFQRWCPAVKAHAASLGKNDFFIFGEFYCSRERAATMVGRGKSPNHYGQPYQFIDSDYTMDGGINYRAYFDFFQSAVKDQVNGNLGNLKTGLDADMNSYDFFDPVWNEVRYTHLNFYNNHDQWRMVHNAAGAAEGFLKTDLSSAIIAFWPGIPLFYYGDEQGFCSYGTALDGWSREDFMTSLAWDNVGSLVGTNTAQKDNFDMCNPQFLWVQKCMNVREKYPALQVTQETYERWKQTGSGNGIYAYSRVFGAPNEWALVAFNTWRDTLWAGGQLGDFWTGWNQGDVIVNALNPSENYTLGSGGELPALALNGYETKVFVLQGNFKNLSPVVTSASPAHDERVANNNQTVRLRFSEPMDETSVKAAFRYDGQPVAAAALTWDPPQRELSYSVIATEGIHTVEVLSGAVSAAGVNLFGKFRSRFLYGSDSNILVNRAATNDVNLIENGAAVAASTTVTLHHKATGAVKMRVKVGGAWTAWQPYAPTTSCTLTPGNGNKSVEVQYWADGSAAYFVSDTIELGLSGALATENFSGYSGSLYGQGGGSGWSGNWYDQGFGTSPNVVSGALNPVNTISSTTPFMEYPLNNSTGGANVLEATRNLNAPVTSGTVYVYGLISVSSAGGGSFSTANSFGGIGLYSGTTEKFLIGQRWQAASWGATASGNLNGAGADSSSSIESITTTLLCAKIDFNTRVLTLWVNPNFNQSETCATSSASFAFGNSDASFDVVRLRAGNANNGNNWQFDNINLTTLSPFAATSPGAIVSGSSTICLGDSHNISAELSGSAPWTITWSDGVVQNSSSSPASRNVSPTISTQYTITALNDSAGCSADSISGSAMVTVKARATVDAGPDQVISPAAPWAALAGAMGGSATTATWSGGTGTFENFNNGTGRYHPTEQERYTTRSVTLTLTSGGQSPCASASDSMTITFNSPPVAANETLARPPGAPLNIRISNLLTNDSDPELDAFTLTDISSTSATGVPLFRDSTFIYYTNSLSVNDSFSYTVTDSLGASASATVYIESDANVSGRATGIELGINSSIVASFEGRPGYAYQVQRSTNVNFSGTLRLWPTNAPPAGLWQIIDDFSDVSPAPPEAFYRSRWISDP